MLRNVDNLFAVIAIFCYRSNLEQKLESGMTLADDGEVLDDAARGSRSVATTQVLQTGPSGVEVDFNFWSRMARWTFEEAVALVHSIEPDLVLSDTAPKFRKILQLVSRAQEAGFLSNPVSPPDFMAWAKQNEIPMPPELSRLVMLRSDHWIDWKAEAHKRHAAAEIAAEGFEHYKLRAVKAEQHAVQLESELENYRANQSKSRTAAGTVISPRSFSTVLKLVGGMAIAIYNYKPEEPRSDAVRQIQNDLDLKGISMDADTIRKWIREGVKLIHASEIGDD